MGAQPFDYEDDGTRLKGALYQPTGAANGRAILVVHEADGIGGNVHRRCAMLSELGFVALAADMHGDGRVLSAAEIPPALESFRSDPARLRRRVRAALDALQAATRLAPGQIAAIGYCFGGMAVLELARDGAAVAAVISFHGLLGSEAPAARGAIRTRVLACTGALDPLVPPEQVVAFQREMSAARADWHLVVHGRALHSYTNVDVDQMDDPRMAYDPAADRQSWSAAMTFLEESFAP